jgi:D-serine deaminase-like pyridoxal phosphate-dependent protein
MAAGGITDVFVAYPLWAGGEKGTRVATLHEHISLTVGVDSAEGCSALGAATAGARTPLPVLVEVDSGERRTGAVTVAQALVVARAARAAGLDVRGAFTHGGHSYHPGAALPAADDEVRVLEEAGRALTAEGFEVRTLSAGSTPTAMLSSRGGVTEERPGTYVFGDRQQAHYGSDPRHVAMVVAATVVSTAAPHQFVIDAGAKALGKDRAPWMQGHGAVPAYPDAVIARVYDHHGVCEVPEGSERPSVGDVVAVVPNHACPVLNLATSFLVVSGGKNIGEWSVDARARNA